MRCTTTKESPRSIESLLENAHALIERTLGDLSHDLGWAGSQANKGRAGQLLERALGATSGSLDMPDFPDLGVELKTIPICSKGKVLESTFVASVDYARLRTADWQESRVWRKLGHVLWVPLLSGPDVLWENRQVGRAYLWQPTIDESAMLQQDWEHLQAMMMTEHMSVSAYAGTILQLRPKAADAKARITTFDDEIGPRTVHPHAYYLRARFTETLLWRLSS